jgi:hypothetical protein
MPRVRLATLRAACSRSSGEAVPGSWIPETRFLGPDAAAALLSTLPPLGLSGSAVYDALVAAAAREHGLTRLTRDRRAVPTYRALDVEYELVS